jgi:hypothetical protein
MHDTLQRPEWACVLHKPPTGSRPWRPADDGYTTCWACGDTLRHLLADISRRYLQLNPTPHTHTADGTPGTPGFASRSPASDHVIAMTDPRSSAEAHVWVAADGRIHHEPEHPPLSVYGVLNTWAWDVTERRGYTSALPVTVHGLCVWLAQQLDWLTRQPDIVDFAGALHRLNGQLKPVTGERRIPIGRCTACGTRLHAPLHGDTVHCHNCDTSWPYSEWITLGDLLTTAG